MNSALISIIVPVYNVRKYLKQCIDSLIMQTYKHIEIILVDDGSTDGSGEICDEYGCKDKRIKVYHKSNGGLSSARNYALERINGEFIGFIDSDDYADPDMYSLLMRNMDEYNADIVDCSRVVFTDERIIKRGIDDNGVSIWTGAEALNRLMCLKDLGDNPKLAVWSRLYKRNIIDNLKFPDGMIHEDILYDTISFLRAKKYVFLHKPLVFHRIRKNSIMQSPFSIKDYDKLRLIHERTKYIEDNSITDCLESARVNEAIWNLRYYIYAANNSDSEWKKRICRITKEYKSEVLNSDIPYKIKTLYILFLINPKLFVLLNKMVGKNKPMEQK